MKNIKLLSLLLVCILILNIPFVCIASAENFVDRTEFELKVSSADAAQTPGNVLVQVFCTTDSSKLITTFGTTLVVNTDYVDLVSKSGEIITDSFKNDATPLGADFALSASKIGAKKQTFGGMKGLSIASYNSATKNMYIFICGMTISGIRINGKTELARFYLKTKTDKVPASALRVMALSEGAGKVCPSKAVYVAEISSTTEAGSVVDNIKLDVDSSLIDKSAPEQTTTQKQAEQTTTKPAQAQTTTALNDEAIDKMSEEELESNIAKIIDADKNLNISDKVKSSTAYKNYKKALDNAEKVLSDKNATKAGKAQALKEVVKAKNELEKEFPEVDSSTSSSELSKKSRLSPLLYVAVAVAVAAIVIVLIIIIRKRKAN